LNKLSIVLPKFVSSIIIIVATDLATDRLVIVEMITGTLSWRSMKRTNTNKLLTKCPSELNRIVDHLLQLDYYSRPDYDLIHRALMSIVERKHWSLADSFDWEDS
jgi:hypothetical protein